MTASRHHSSRRGRRSDHDVGLVARDDVRDARRPSVPVPVSATGQPEGGVGDERGGQDHQEVAVAGDEIGEQGAAHCSDTPTGAVQARCGHATSPSRWYATVPLIAGRA